MRIEEKNALHQPKTVLVFFLLLSSLSIYSSVAFSVLKIIMKKDSFSTHAEWHPVGALFYSIYSIYTDRDSLLFDLSAVCTHITVIGLSVHLLWMVTVDPGCIDDWRGKRWLHDSTVSSCYSVSEHSNVSFDEGVGVHHQRWRQGWEVGPLRVRLCRGRAELTDVHKQLMVLLLPLLELLGV